jgi:Ner family transcriptional regulator
MAQEVAGLHAEKIKAEIRIRFGTIKGFAQRFGLSAQSVSDVLGGVRINGKVETVIADALEMNPHALWPERWTSDGRRLHATEFRKAIQNEQAAA